MLKVGKKLSIAFVSLAMIIGCGDPTEPEELVVTLDKSFYLNLGETAQVEGEQFRITLTELVFDERCPATAYCHWPGTVRIELLLDGVDPNPVTTQLDLLAGADSVTKDLFSEDTLGYNIRFEEFLPYPQSHEEMAKATSLPPLERRARLRISKTASRPKVDGNVTITGMDPSTFRFDSFDLDSAWVVGDTLMLNVEVGGGCERHYYFLFMSPETFAESNPVQANIYLRHFGNFDNCAALLLHTLRFDITQIRHNYEQLYGRFDPIRLNVYDYFETTPGESRAVIYAPTHPLLPIGVGRYWIYDVYDPRLDYHLGGDYVDTITIVHSEYVNGKRWWYLTGKNPGLLLGFSDFSYRADTVVSREPCGSYWVESREFIPLPAGSHQYLSSDCLSAETYYADRVSDTIFFEWCRYCADAGIVRKVVPGIGVVSGGATMFIGAASWTLIGYGVE